MSVPVVKVDRPSLTSVTAHFAITPKPSTEAPDALKDVHHLDDLVFIGRNQAYGAYTLRKGYTNTLYKSVLISVLLAFTVIFSPAIVKIFDRTEPVEKVTSRKLVYSELTAPPPIDKPKPPPPQVQLPKLQKVIKFVPPKVVRETVTEDVPTIMELKQNETAAVGVDGTEDIVFDEPVAEVINDVDEIFTVVEQQPEFEGGYEAMLNFIRKHMIYPATARRMQIDGTVHVSFIVSRTGTISDVKVLRGIQTDCDNEAIRVVKLMPPWKPGTQNGKPVHVRFIMPIKFRLN